MRRRFTVGLGAAAAALLTVTLGVGPASASTVTDTSVSQNWGYAYAKTQWRLNPYRLDPVYLEVKDKLADGHSVGIRLVTYGDAGRHYFPIRRVSTGAGTYNAWLTYANPGGWIDYAYVQLCQMEGSQILKCIDSRIMYPAFDDSGAAPPFPG
ncbi:hypothetical protein [Streptomyces sp. NPDC060194]|uniref:hypothetical protein n=1 Tax=Streptomyces sp. NPDC060194 TaxID=3347069 RepID=UPI00366642DB